MGFDAYNKWLGIPPAEQPPHYYRLLGVGLFEDDPDVIEGAADRQMAHVRTFQAGQHSALSQTILNELAAAKLCLLDPRQKAIYDSGLRSQIAAVHAAKQPNAPERGRAMASGACVDHGAAQVILEIATGPIQGRSFTFDRHDTFLFGRHSACHARITKDERISRHQFILEANPPDARIRDLGSRNGTYVNGVKFGGRAADEEPEQGAARIYPAIDLKHGDTITVGRTDIHVRVALPPRAQKTEPVRCDRCGKDVAHETRERKDGQYFCRTCRSHLLADTLSLRHLVEHAAGKKRDSMPVSIAGYELGEELGKGGMGVVYRAKRASDGARVAVKIMLARVVVDEQARGQFLREIDVTRRLAHRNVVRLLDSGTVGGAFYFVMEYCDSGSAQALAKRHGGKLPLALAGPLFLDCLDGLEHAHQAGFVHRDLKPSNILLDDRDGRFTARIADFGLAKCFDTAGLSGMTTTGDYGGTFPFMPPEQISNFRFCRPVSDVWSMAATFYYLLSGHYVFDFPQDRDPLAVILGDQPVPIVRRIAAVRRPLAKVIDRALLVNAGRRYQSAAEFKAEIGRTLA